MSATNSTTPKSGYNNILIGYISPEVAADGISFSNDPTYPAAGSIKVNIDPLNGQVKTDKVAELTAAAGVTVDGTLIKDGGVRLANNTNLSARNAANSADVNLFKLNASNLLEVDATATAYQAWVPTLGAGGSMTYTSTSIQFARYRQNGSQIHLQARVTGTTGGTASNFLTLTLPVAASNAPGNLSSGFALVADGTSDGVVGYAVITNGSTTCKVYKGDASNWGLGANRLYIINFIYEV